MMVYPVALHFVGGNFALKSKDSASWVGSSNKVIVTSGPPIPIGFGVAINSPSQLLCTATDFKTPIDLEFHCSIEPSLRTLTLDVSMFDGTFFSMKGAADQFVVLATGTTAHILKLV